MYFKTTICVKKRINDFLNQFHFPLFIKKKKKNNLTKKKMHKLATVCCKYEKKDVAKFNKIINFKTGQSTFITPVKSIWNNSFWNFSFFHFIQWFSPSRHSVIFLEFLLCEKEQQVVSSRDSIRVHSFAMIHRTVYV